ncbi:histidinol-phosphatase [Balneola sp. MJW-20]|uniref:histidinol-phosphatase n=1 Tax=Gracilimonas aurantiaca TaxID=3234185 RepID=UPI00346681F9
MHKDLLASAVEFAKIGGEHTLRYFGKNLEVDFKSDESPVTVADRETEEIIRDIIEQRFPDHGIVGEEFGAVRERSDYQWILDPIDGTRSFIHGVPFYTTLIGLTYKKKAVAGVIYAPALRELCAAAQNMGATLNGEKCSVRNTSTLSEATFLTTDMTLFRELGYEKLLNALLDSTRLHRTWGDAYGHMMVATGRADIMFDPELNIWDAAALLPVITEAGGIFSDMEGEETISGGNGFSANTELHPQIMKIIEQYRK